MLGLRLGYLAVIAVFAPSLALAQPAVKASPWLGVSVAAGVYGVQVREVIDDTPAALAGLVLGDEVVAVADRKVAAPSDLIAAVGKRRIDEKVALTVWRDGRTFQLTVTLSAKPSEEEILHRRLVDKPAPEFRASLVSGDNSPGLMDLRGQVVVIGFLATQCDGCGDVQRRLSRLVDQYPSQGIAVLMLSQEPRRVLRTWAQSLAPSFTVAHDPAGAIASIYRVARVPTLLVVDRDGAVRYVGIGAEDNLDSAVLTAERALLGRVP